MGEKILEARGIKKSFGGVHALKGVDFTVYKGEVLCLAGENGCGKSTLIKVLTGAHNADEGEVIINGHVYRRLTPQDSMREGIQVIYQDFSVFPNLTVAENIAVNWQIQEKKKLINWKKIEEIARTSMEKLGVTLDLKLPVERLSVANKQIVAICRALLDNASLIIMDEPTTALTSKEVIRLFEIVRKLQEKGIAVVIVNHKLEEVYGIAERLVILRSGENVAEGPMEEFDTKRFVMCMTGREIEVQNYRPSVKNEKELFRVENLGCKNIFKEVSFTMNKGDILGITGLLGSGRGEIGEALFGILRPTEGEIYFEGNPIVIRSVRDAIKNGICYVPEDRLTQGLFLEQPIGANMIIASIKKYRKRFALDYKKMEMDIVAWIKKLNVAAVSSKPYIKTLSGGNQQKVVLAKWLNHHPKVLILNGPTVGVDVGSKADIHNILRDLASQGIGIILISDDLPELEQNCNSVLIMKQGKPAGILRGDEIKQLSERLKN